MKSIVVFYHKNCLDGFGSAWAAWRKFGDRAEYIGLEPRRPIVPKIKNKEIYFLDVAPHSSELKNLTLKNKKVVFIDHHISRRDMTGLTTESIFSLNNSAALLSWKYFHPKQKAPALLKFIEDYDLWRFKLKQTREFIAALQTYDFDFKLWSKIALDFEFPKRRQRYFEEGRVVLRMIRKIVEELADGAPEVIFEAKRAIAVNSPIFDSEIGHYIYEKKGVPIGIVWSEENGEINVGLRSNKNVDVSKIAQKFGGGGHKHAAGFRLKPKIKFPWRKAK